MSERMVLYLGQNLDWVELNGMPRFIDDRVYALGTMPSKERFPRDKDQDVLVWSQRENKRFLFLGILRRARIEKEERVLRYDCFERLARPVLIYDELGKEGVVDHTTELQDGQRLLQRLLVHPRDRVPRGDGAFRATGFGVTPRSETTMALEEGFAPS